VGSIPAGGALLFAFCPKLVGFDTALFAVGARHVQQDAAPIVDVGDALQKVEGKDRAFTMEGGENVAGAAGHGLTRCVYNRLNAPIGL